MRTIKFRGQPKNGIGWVTGYYVYTFEIGYNSESHDYVPPRKHYIFGDSGDYCEVTPESVGQYTGLKDKNGKEIYEGDICLGYREGEDVHYEILWMPHCAKYGAKVIKSKYVLSMDMSFPLQHYIKDGKMECVFEVIGNIYETPELE